MYFTLKIWPLFWGLLLLAFLPYCFKITQPVLRVDELLFLVTKIEEVLLGTFSLFIQTLWRKEKEFLTRFVVHWSTVWRWSGVGGSPFGRADSLVRARELSLQQVAEDKGQGGGIGGFVSHGGGAGPGRGGVAWRVQRLDASPKYMAEATSYFHNPCVHWASQKKCTKEKNNMIFTTVTVEGWWQ